MDVWIVAVTAVISAVVAGGGAAWWCTRTTRALRERLAKVEAARAAAHERSTQARAQIHQLSQAIAEMQRRHRVAIDEHHRRAELDALVPSSPASQAAAHGFADTQPL